MIGNEYDYPEKFIPRTQRDIDMFNKVLFIVNRRIELNKKVNRLKPISELMGIDESK